MFQPTLCLPFQEKYSNAATETVKKKKQKKGNAEGGGEAKINWKKKGEGGREEYVG